MIDHFPDIPMYPGVSSPGNCSLFRIKGNYIDLHAINHLFVFCYCISGSAVGSVDLLPVTITKGSIAVLVPGQLVQPLTLSPDFDAIVMILSQQFVMGMELPYDFQFAVKLRDNPVLSDVPDNILRTVFNFFTVVKRVLSESGHYWIHILRHLTAAFGYIMVEYVEGINSHIVRSNDQQIMYRFMAEVKAHFRHQRKVAFYADVLHLAPAYLSTVVKQISGQPPSYWIEHYVAECAKGLLRSTDMTVCGISEDLGFPSASFFGKFFKRVTGQSPSEFRNRRL